MASAAAPSTVPWGYCRVRRRATTGLCGSDDGTPSSAIVYRAVKESMAALPTVAQNRHGAATKITVRAGCFSGCGFHRRRVALRVRCIPRHCPAAVLALRQALVSRAISACSDAASPALPLVSTLNRVYATLLENGLDAQFNTNDSLGLGEIADPASHSVRNGCKESAVWLAGLGVPLGSQAPSDCRRVLFCAAAAVVVAVVDAAVFVLQRRQAGRCAFASLVSEWTHGTRWWCAPTLWHRRGCVHVFLMLLRNGMAEALGDGFLWGGTLVTFLLGQTRRLQLADLASQVQEDLEVLQIMRAAAPAAPDSITVHASFYKASVALVGKIDAYREVCAVSPQHPHHRGVTRLWKLCGRCLLSCAVLW